MNTVIQNSPETKAQNTNIRRAKTEDIPDLNRLLYEVHKIHSDARPDLFKPGAKNTATSN